MMGGFSRGKPMPFCRGTALLQLLLLVVASARGSGEDIEPMLKIEVEPDSMVACTVDDLIPPHDEDISDMWDMETLVSPPFDCTCRNLKASYHCPHLGTGGYPKWIPRSVSTSACRPKHKGALKKDPLPPGFKVLVYGNSHLRQVVESITCAYSRVVRSRKVTLFDTHQHRVTESPGAVSATRQCRGCVGSRHSMLPMLLENGCVSKEEAKDACRCATDESAFEFENGAVIHYHFAHKEGHKSIWDALKVQGTEFSDYDAVIANLGNEPRMEVSETLRAAGLLKKAGVPFFWLSAYEGEGDIGGWLPEEQEEFWDHGARFIPVHRMVESLKYLTKGAVEGETNPHFCLPGPPSEIGILLLKMAWALHDENGTQPEDGEDESTDDRSVDEDGNIIGDAGGGRQ